MTSEQKVQALLRAPWTVLSSPADEDPTQTALRIRELPEFVVVGSGKALADEFWNSLESLLESYVDDGQEPPLPAGFGLPRVSGVHRQVVTAEVSVSVGSVSQGNTLTLAGTVR